MLNLYPLEQHRWLALYISLSPVPSTFGEEIFCKVEHGSEAMRSVHSVENTVLFIVYVVCAMFRNVFLFLPAGALLPVRAPVPLPALSSPASRRGVQGAQEMVSLLWDYGSLWFNRNSPFNSEKGYSRPRS